MIKVVNASTSKSPNTLLCVKLQQNPPPQLIQLKMQIGRLLNIHESLPARILSNLPQTLSTFYSLLFFIIQLHTYEALIYRLRMPVSESPNVKKKTNKQIKACHRAVLGPAHPKVMCYCSKFSNYITVTFKSLLVLQVICTLSGYPIYERAHNTNK